MGDTGQGNPYSGIVYAVGPHKISWEIAKLRESILNRAFLFGEITKDNL